MFIRARVPKKEDMLLGECGAATKKMVCRRTKCMIADGDTEFQQIETKSEPRRDIIKTDEFVNSAARVKD